MKVGHRVMVLGAALLCNAVNAESLYYAAREETIYTGDQVVTDSGGPSYPGNDGEIFLQFLTYFPQLAFVSTSATVTWDESVEQLIGFTESSFNADVQVKEAETVTWLFGAGSWTPASNEVFWATLGTTVIERSPLLAPVVPPDGTGGEIYPTSDQLLEMQMAGVPDAACIYLGRCDGYLDGLTWDQYLQDMQAIEAILAGIYTPPPVPVPAPWVLLASALGMLVWRAQAGRVPQAARRARQLNGRQTRGPQAQAFTS